MKHKNLSWAQRTLAGKLKLKRLLSRSQFSPKDMNLKKQIRIADSEARQRNASIAAKRRVL